MIFRDLLVKFPWTEMEQRIVELYPDQEVNLDLYEDVYETLISLDVEKDLEKIEIIIELVKDAESEFYDISGIVEGESIGYGLQFLRWEKWLGLPIYHKTLKTLSELDILIHCLWEMTYSGFTQEEINEAKMGLDQPEDAEDFITLEVSENLKIEMPKSMNAEVQERTVEFFKEMMESEDDSIELHDKMKEKNKDEEEKK